MTDPRVPTTAPASEVIEKRAANLIPGDMVAPHVLPWSRRRGEVTFVDTYPLGEELRTFVAYKDEDGVRESAHFSATAMIQLLPRPATLVPEPIAKHYETGSWKGEGPGSCGADCACGEVFDGFDSLAEATDQLRAHIAQAATAPAPITGRLVPPADVATGCDGDHEDRSDCADA